MLNNKRKCVIHEITSDKYKTNKFLVYTNCLHTSLQIILKQGCNASLNIIADIKIK